MLRAALDLFLLLIPAETFALAVLALLVDVRLRVVVLLGPAGRNAIASTDLEPLLLLLPLGVLASVVRALVLRAVVVAGNARSPRVDAALLGLALEIDLVNDYIFALLGGARPKRKLAADHG